MEVVTWTVWILHSVIQSRPVGHLLYPANMRAAEPEQYMGLFVVIGFSRVRLPKRLRLSTACFMPEVLRLVVWKRYSEAAVPFLSAFRNADIAAHESVKRLLQSL